MRTRTVKNSLGEPEVRDLPDYFEDKAGRQVWRGDYIVYGHALGRCAGLRFGKVLDIERIPPRYGDRKPTWSILVQGVDDDWGARKPKLCKPGRLQFPSRIIKLDSLPDGCEYLLDDVEPIWPPPES